MFTRDVPPFRSTVVVSSRPTPLLASTRKTYPSLSLPYLCPLEYGHFRGQVLNDGDLSDLVSGLRTNHLLHFSHVLTGALTDIVPVVFPEGRNVSR